MINNSTYLTKKCRCDNPDYKVELTKRVRSGKNYRKVKYLLYCRSCGSQWWTTVKPKEIEEKLGNCTQCKNKLTLEDHNYTWGLCNNCFNKLYKHK